MRNGGSGSIMASMSIDFKILEEFLELGGPDMRAALVAQVQSDLKRCHDVIESYVGTDSTDMNMQAICKAAHEIKGVAATIGATPLVDLAKRTETACTSRDTKALGAVLPMLRAQTLQAAEEIAVMARAH